MALRAVTEPTKVCAGTCGERKPYSDFHVKTRWPDGTIRQPQAYCKRCQAERTRQWRKRNPDLRRQQIARQHASVKGDSERWATKLANWRHNYHARKGTVMPIRGGSPDRSPRVDVAPFAAWLSTLGTTSTEIARATGMRDDRVRQYLATRMQTVSLDVVDQACLHAGQDLNSLYPIEHAA